MGNTSYDTLTITINADSKQANASISRLSTNLRKLETTAKELDTKRIEEVKELLQGIANIDFSNVANGLRDIVNAFKAFQSKSFMKGADLSGMYAEDYEPNFVMYEQALATIDKSINTTTYALQAYSQAFDDAFGDNANQKLNTIRDNSIFDRLKEALMSAGFFEEQISALLSNIHKEASKLSNGDLKKMRDVMKGMGIPMKEINKALKGLGNNGNKASNGLKKVANQFKNIMKYRIIRKIIQELYKALSEGLKNIATFDTGLQESLGRLQSAFTFVKNSIGAMLAPLVQIITPILEEVMMIVGELGNTFAELFASANGQSTFSKATYDLKKYNEEAKKTQALGIDELNVLSQDDNAGGFTTEQVQLGEKTESVAGAIKNIFAKIKQIVDKIKPVIEDLTNKLLPALSCVLTNVVSIISTILDLVMTLVGQTFGEVHNSLANFFEMVGSILGFVNSIVNILSTVLTPIMHVISSIINIINSALGGVFKIIGAIFEILQPIANIINVLLVPLSALLTVVSTIFYVIQGIVQTIVKIVTFDWGHIGDTWAEVGNNIKKAWEDMGKVAEQSVQGFATGGFPEDGLFFANHTELVGKFSNGKTAVANNAQITEGIYEAVKQAMQEGGAQGGISIQIDGQELAKIITKKQNNFGADLIVGGNLAYGK